MSLAKKLLGAMGEEEKQYVDDVFSTYLYTGNGETQTINNGIDLAGKGGMVWGKSRTNAVSVSHYLFDTLRGPSFSINTNTTAGQNNNTISGFTSTGFSLNTSSVINRSESYASWTFRRAPKFFELLPFTHTNGTAKTIDLSYLGTVGFVTIKRTDTAGDWYAWHRSLTAGNNLKLNTTDAQSTSSAFISVSGTMLTFAASAPTGTYMLYGWAHDESADGIIQCGSYVGNGSINGPTVNIGWESQFLLIKGAVFASGSGLDWRTMDNMRGLTTDGFSPGLNPNTSGSEELSQFVKLNSTGFSLTGTGYNNGSATYIYLAIRRPNKPPTTGTQVYKSIARDGTSANTLVQAEFPVDLAITGARGAVSKYPMAARLSGAAYLIASTDGAEFPNDSSYYQQNPFDSNSGIKIGTATSTNSSINQYVDWLFRRAPGFFDAVCDTGAGVARSIAHNLTVAPGLVIRKSRSAATQWEVWHSALAASEKLVFNSTAAKVTDATAWNSTAPGASSLTVGTGANVNANGATFVTYLWATLAGVSKVGSYTGNGGTQAIDCGFTTGARFILVKRIDAAGDWFVWDSARGIVSGNDPHLSLNTTAAEVTTDDSVDPDPLGFVVNQVAATNINVSGGQYLFLAIS